MVAVANEVRAQLRARQADRDRREMQRVLGYRERGRRRGDRAPLVGKHVEIRLGGDRHPDMTAEPQADEPDPSH